MTHQRGSVFAAAVAVALALLCTVAHARYATGRGGCEGPGLVPLKIDSARENAAAARYLQREAIPHAALAGYVIDGISYWDDGGEVAWVPPSFRLPTSANGFLILRSDGSWDWLPDVAFFKTPSLCSDGQPETEMPSSTLTPTVPPANSTMPPMTSTVAPTNSTMPPMTSTVAPTNSTVPPMTSTVAPANSTVPPMSTTALPETTTAAPQSTTVPSTLAPVDVAAVVGALQSAFNAAGAISVAAYTANAVQISAASASAALQRLVAVYGTVYLGIGDCNAQTLTAKWVAALVASPKTAEVGFYLPYDVAVTATTTTHNLCLMGHRTPASSKPTMAPPTSFAPLAATLKVFAVGDVVTALQGTVAVNYEDTLDGEAHTKSLTVTGAGTATPHTTELSPSFFRGFTFSLVNNGVIGRACTPSSNAVPFLLARNTLQLTLSAANVKLIANGEKSICAAYGADSTVVVARLTQTALLATAPRQKYTFGTAIPARLHGASTNSLAKGRVTAFLATSAQCATSGAVQATLEVSLSSGAAPDPPSSADAFVPHFFITAPLSASGSAKYVCLTYSATAGAGGGGTTFKLVTVASAAGSALAQVSVTGAAAVARPTKLTIFNGMEGSVMLTKYVAPVSSQGDQVHYDMVMALISGSAAQFVRFVPMRVTAGTTQMERTAACRRSASAAEVTTTVQGGVLALTAFTRLSQPSGVLCVGEAYVRVDYAVVDPTAWLRTFGGTTDFSSSAFVLSITPASGSVGDASPLTFAGSEYHGDIALRLSSTGDCTLGNAAPVRSYDEGSKWMVALPGSGLGIYTICVGLYSSDGGVDHAAFASTGRTMSMAPYAIALSNWKANAGVTAGTWTSCGGAAACGAVTTQYAKQVCPTSVPVLDPTGSGAVVRTWPSRLADEVNYLGAFSVQMDGNGVTVSAGVYLGAVYTAPANAEAHCQQYGLLELSTDLVSYSTSVVATMNRPFVSFRPSSQLTGATFGLAEWDQECTAASVQLRAVVADNTFDDDSNSGELGSSTFDVSPLLYANREGYYRLCYTTGARGTVWSGVALSYVKVVRDRLMYGVQIEAIGTGSPADNQDSIRLWQTQSTTWSVAGEFDHAVAVWLVLVWDDPTCAVATPAYSTPVTVLSTTGGRVSIDTSLIASPPAAPAEGDSHALHPCFRTSLSSEQHPLSFEARRKRRITLSPLALSSINYLPHYVVSYRTETDTSIQITDPRKPPITQVTLFIANSLEDRDTTTAHCSITSQNYVATLPTTVDGFGMRWLIVPVSVLRMVGGAGRDLYLLLCATASTAASPPFELVDAYVTVNRDGMDEANDVYLDLTFTPQNHSTDVLEVEGARAALVAYVMAVVPGVTDAQVMVSSMGYNHFALYVQPQQPAGVTSPTAALYAALAAGTQLPLRALSTVNMSLYVLSSEEGRRLGTQSPHATFPYVALRTSSQEVVVVNGAAFSIALFCIVVTPTVVGFVIFSLQRTIPSLTHKKKGVEATLTVCKEAGDSPPPRNPRGEQPVEEASGDSSEAVAPATARASQVEFAVEPNAEDTAANPLYDDSEDEAPAADDDAGLTVAEIGAGLMGASPPLRNATFAMSGARVLGTPTGSPTS